MKHQPNEFDIRPCTKENLDEILEIQSEVFEQLDSEEILRKNTPEMLERCLAAPHITIGAFYKETLAAFTVLYIPGDSDESLSGYLLGLDTGDMTSANYKLCIVRNEFRGNGLQLRLGNEIERHARALGADILCATASPHNPYSIRNILALGFVYNRTLIVQKYGGLERALYYKLLTGDTAASGTAQ